MKKIILILALLIGALTTNAQHRLTASYQFQDTSKTYHKPICLGDSVKVFIEYWINIGGSGWNEQYADSAYSIQISNDSIHWFRPRWVFDRNIPIFGGGLQQIFGIMTSDTGKLYFRQYIYQTGVVVVTSNTLTLHCNIPRPLTINLIGKNNICTHDYGRIITLNYKPSYYYVMSHDTAHNYYKFAVPDSIASTLSYVDVSNAYTSIYNFNDTFIFTNASNYTAIYNQFKFKTDSFLVDAKSNIWGYQPNRHEYKGLYQVIAQDNGCVTVSNEIAIYENPMSTALTDYPRYEYATWAYGDSLFAHIYHFTNPHLPFKHCEWYHNGVHQPQFDDSTIHSVRLLADTGYYYTLQTDTFGCVYKSNTQRVDTIYAIFRFLNQQHNTTGINDLNILNSKLYYYNNTLYSNDGLIEIYSITGVLLRKENFTELNINLQPGIYIAKNKNRTIKFTVYDF